MPADVAEPPAKIARDDCKFKDDHMAIFRNHGLAWPPDFPKSSPCLPAMCTKVSRRQAEVAFFMDATTTAGAEPHFCDINLSLVYLVGGIGDVGKDRRGFAQAG